ncbi:hypothetical protein CANCADRAFT_109254 [Tortispora caseinolytica NRRL Y-17796]|uniref:Uncharacterized protein n=1 Tax=Tortispora caseinolytica NRRL Y-17796 TaxID=767744 RepID=A0A1E4TG52_9ASCO|nr:hypothetical protein CANCADRAFT_109254 [Tortispora caseinolytica NRRL Y-17796]
MNSEIQRQKLQKLKEDAFKSLKDVSDANSSNDQSVDGTNETIAKSVQDTESINTGNDHQTLEDLYNSVINKKIPVDFNSKRSFADIKRILSNDMNKLEKETQKAIMTIVRDRSTKEL